MSAYTSRALAYRRKADRRNRIGARVAICVMLLFTALVSGFVGYMFFRYNAQIAARWHDEQSTIWLVGFWAWICAFVCLLATPAVAAGLHESGR